MSAATRPKFRETLWFVKGQKDQDAADEAAMSGDDLAPVQSDMLPIEDRYLDDGTVRPSLTNMFGLHTGTTEYIQPITSFEPSGTTLNTKAMIGDLKRGRIRVVAAIGASALALAAVLAVYMF